MSLLARPKILVVDDEAHMREMLELGLAQYGFDVRTAADGSAALVAARDWRPDVVVLDIMMPKVDGMSLIPMLRSESEAPIVMLSARTQAEDKIAALTTGADDYVCKPFDLGELAARLHSRLRRPQLAKRDTLQYGGIVMDLTTRTVERDGESMVLTTREFDLLSAFMREPGRVFTREQLIDRAWGFDAEVAPNVVESYVSYLRAKIDRAPFKRLIQTVRRVGYSLREE